MRAAGATRGSRPHHGTQGTGGARHGAGERPGVDIFVEAADGVRSFQQVFLHIANGNQLLLKIATTSPDSEATKALIEEQSKKEAAPATKEQILAALAESFTAIHGTLNRLRGHPQPLGGFLRHPDHHQRCPDQSGDPHGRAPRAGDRLRAHERHRAAMVAITDGAATEWKSSELSRLTGEAAQFCRRYGLADEVEFELNPCSGSRS